MVGRKSLNAGEAAMIRQKVKIYTKYSLSLSRSETHETSAETEEEWVEERTRSFSAR